MLNKKDQELALADVIFVASSFTKKTLEHYSGNLPEIKVIPYGFPKVYNKRIYQPLTNRKLKILFVGGLSQRKGLSYLFEAVEGLQDKVELTVVGHKAVSNCKALNLALEQHHWIPSLSHDKVLACMREHDVFVFPSLFEGFGLVLLEALSQGIPVITTPHTGGPDILTEGEDGYIVPIRDSAAIAEKLTLLTRDRRHLQEMKASALRKAAQLTWQKYRSDLLSAGSPLFA